MKIKTSIIVAILFSVCLFSCKTEPSDSTNETKDSSTSTEMVDVADLDMEWKTFEHEKFSISYPANWSVESIAQTEFAAQEGTTSASDNISENMNVVIEPSKFQGNMKQYLEASKKGIRQGFNDVIFESSQKITNDYSELIWTDPDPSADLRFFQYFWLVNKQGYIVTMTCNPDQADDYYPIARAVAETFTVK